VLTYLFAAAYFLAGGTMKLPGVLVIGVAYMLVPGTTAIFVQKVVYKAPLKGPLRINFRFNRWFLVALLLPLIIALATLGVSLLLPGVTFVAGKGDFGNLLIEPQQLGMPRGFWIGIILGLLQGLITGITVNAVAGFGEELGWRGLMQRELGPLGFWRASGLIGLTWGFWHAPLILRGLNYPNHPWAGVFLMTVQTLLLAPLFGYIALKANSVVAAAIFHGTFNGASVVATFGLQASSGLLIGVTGLGGFLVLLVANLCLLIFDSPWARRGESCQGL
jgi:uncharacterized protein